MSLTDEDRIRIETVVAMLRTAAGWGTELDPVTCLEVAEGAEIAFDDFCCPVCEEVTCDTGCPLEPVRRGL